MHDIQYAIDIIHHDNSLLHMRESGSIFVSLTDSSSCRHNITSCSKAFFWIRPLKIPRKEIQLMFLKAIWFIVHMKSIFFKYITHIAT
jgi:hypothetical protein